ncbi:GNAT family N-acetyltransferase [Ornithinibacillus sp. 4-3]|uniref:GNAT family N-acetyltransferase n=1 Tax=Ornithinibacillus sp. 4-3 TaxID=3231488 RepID=A0AB39HS68_9BACI
MSWNAKLFHELSLTELYQLLKIRVDVFVVEQQCAYPEIDGLDKQSIHFYYEENETIIAYARILPKGIKYEHAAAIGRVLVHESYRGRGLAKDLIKKVMDYMKLELKESVIQIEAQEHLEDFYTSHGFQKISEPYLEDGIPHIDMIFHRK